MADETLLRDPNRITVNGGVTNDTDLDIVMFRVDAITKRLLVSTALDKDTDEVLMWLNTAKDGTGTDLVPIVDADGHIQVDVLSGGGAGEQYADNTVVSAAYKGNLALGTDGSNYQILAVDSSGNLQVDILNASIAVTGTFWQATQPVSGTFWQATQPVSIAATVATDVTDEATRLLGVVYGSQGAQLQQKITTNDLIITLDGETVAIASIAAGDNNIGNVDIASIAAGDNNIGNVDIVSGTITTVSTLTGGGVAHDAADSGNPVKVGGKAYNFDGTAPGTAVAEADRADFSTDLYGRQYVEITHPNFWSVSADYATAQTNASVKAAPGAGLSLYITDIVISNGAVAGNVTLLDGSGGTVVYEIYPAINGGVSDNRRTPIKLTANTALCITSTSCTTHAINVSGFIAP